MHSLTTCFSRHPFATSHPSPPPPRSARGSSDRHPSFVIHSSSTAEFPQCRIFASPRAHTYANIRAYLRVFLENLSNLARRYTGSSLALSPPPVLFSLPVYPPVVPAAIPISSVVCVATAPTLCFAQSPTPPVIQFPVPLTYTHVYTRQLRVITARCSFSMCLHACEA